MDNEIIKEDKYGHRRRYVELTCHFCKKKHFVRKDFARRGKGKYCSRECHYEDVRKKRVTVKCSICGKKRDIKPSQAKNKPKYGFRFCSRKCKDEAQSVGGILELPHYGQKSFRKWKNISKDGKCINCKIKLNTGRTYCSAKCQQEWSYKDYIQKWKNGEVTGNHETEEHLSTRIRRYMLDKSKHKCSKCGWNEINPKSGKIPLTINHIDGHPYNSVESNLEVLCPNCHSLTPTYGYLNKGNGRKLRLQKINLHKKKNV